MGVCHAQWDLPSSGIPEAESVIWYGLWRAPKFSMLWQQPTGLT